jgi:hypothetical protein
MRLHMPCVGSGTCGPYANSGHTHAPRPTGDYAPSLRSPWRAANENPRLSGNLRYKPAIYRNVETAVYFYENPTGNEDLAPNRNLLIECDLTHIPKEPTGPGSGKE